MSTALIRFARLTVFATASALLCASAFAATVKVKNGDDLQAAIDAASDGDTIVVLKGTYGPIDLTGRQNLTIKGRGKPSIDGSTASNCVLLTDCSDVVVTGFQLRDSQLSAFLAVGCSRIELSKCKINDAGDEGAEFSNCDDIIVDRNKIDGTGDDGIAVSDGSGDQTSNSEITRNKISHVPDGGIDINGDNNLVTRNLVKDSEANGAIVNSGTNNEIVKNVFLRIDGDGVLIDDDGNRVLSNKIVKPTGNGIDLDADQNTASKNVIVKAGQAGVTVGGGENNVTQNKITKSAGVDLQDTSGGDTNTYTGNKAKTLDPEDLPNPKH